MKEMKKKKLNLICMYCFFKLLGFSSHYFIYLKRNMRKNTFLRQHEKSIERQWKLLIKLY